MFLKSVSLYGFKTFALKTDFVFKPGITAILGPNGCGKSNLFDALVWVLGEQSARSIRGYKMEDVIFHGSDAKKALGFAQVQLTFDNEDGYFPLPHSEISITRRYFKSGDSEFEINGQSCRLKDIQSLLMDTGMGKLNYSIISQGDIEYIIGLSPTERRGIFDEAAGINKYKAEKKKTLAKIKDTDANMARLRDLLTEIEDRLNPLNEQAKNARRFEELSERLENLKLRVMVSDIRRIAGTIADFNAQETVLREEMRAVEGKIAAACEAREAKRGNLGTAHAAVSAAGQALGQLTGSLENHEQSLKFLQNSINQSGQARDRVAGEIAAAEKRFKELENEVAELERKKKEKGEQIAALEKELQQALPAETSGFTDDLEHEKQLREEASTSRTQADAIREKAQNLRYELRQVEDRISSSVDAKNEKTREINNAQRQLDEIAKKESRAKAELETIGKTRGDAEEKIKTLKGNIREAMGFAEESRSALAEARASLSYQQARAEYLAAASKAAKAQSSPPSEWITLKDGQPVPLKIEIAPGYEPAVRRALGQMLDAWIVEGADGIKTLSPRRAGEAMFVIADLLAAEGRPEISVKDMPGAAGLLSDYAHADGPEAGAVKALLSRFVVVEDAEKLANLAAGLKPGTALVTKAGDASLDGGLLQLGEGLGGREDLEALHNEARQAAQDARNLISETEKKLSENSRRLSDMNRELSQAESASQKASYRFVELESTLKSVVGEREFHEKALAAVKEALEKFTALSGELAEKKEELSAKAKELESGLSEKRNYFETKEKLLSELLEKRRAAQALLQELRIKISNGRKEIEAAVESVSYRRRDAERMRERGAELDVEKKRIEAELEARAKEFEQAKAGGEQLAGNVIAAKKDFAEKQAFIQAVEEEIAALGVEAANHEKGAAELREKLLQAQVKKARSEGQLEDARKVFAEEFPELDEEKAVAETAAVAPGEKSEYKNIKDELEALGPVNMLAIGEYEDEKGRYDTLYAQIEDLEETRQTLVDMVDNFDTKSREQFLETFSLINEKFKETFEEVFAAGSCEIWLTDASRPLECGVEIGVAMPSKRMRNISLLSGGEKALCALTLIFAILKVKPSPFYLLDEVDAGLDEGNVDKFKRMMKKYSDAAQFFIITHNKGTLVGADHFYGITMSSGDGYTRALSVTLENIDVATT